MFEGDGGGAQSPDEFPILGIDHIEFFVGNAKQAAYYFTHAFGFDEIARAGLETGNRDAVSHVMEQGYIRFVLTGALSPNAVADEVHEHGDGVCDIALRVPDAKQAFEKAVASGAMPYKKPEVHEDENGHVITAAIKTYGDTIHTFIQREHYRGRFMPGYEPVTVGRVENMPDGVGLHTVDHVVGNVELDMMDDWASYYAQVMGFKELLHFKDDQISTKYTALMSKVMWDGVGRVKFPINEPAEGEKKSQIEEYLDFYRGPGVQHIALATDDIVRTVSQLQKRGVEFLTIPDAYYNDVRKNFSDIEDVNIDALANLGILADRDDEGYLLQIFTRPLVDRPTLFFEIIERQGSRGFGKGNFKALFEAIEREQEKRGNL